MMARRRASAFAACVLATLTLSAASARAETDAGGGEQEVTTAETNAPDAGAPPMPEPPARDPEAVKAEERLEEAKRLFREGNALRKAGDYQRALERYSRSRALVPSMPNTLNAAFCLEKLGRDDEALDLYEALISTLTSELSDAERTAVADAMRALRSKVGSVEVSSNVEGKLVIAGRMRGTLPLPGPVRVLPGKHVVRVIKDGYAAFEETVNVEAGRSVKVDARLSPLTSAGRLRIEATSTPGAEVYIDGAMVGVVPWEGTLAPGAHLYWIREGERGTAPAAATVVQGQTVLVRASAVPLGPTLRVLVDPPTAPLSIDGVQMGKGAWSGRLPLGAHTLQAREEGYLDGSVEHRVEAGREVTIKLELRINRAHPRWARAAESRLYAEVFAGFGLSKGLGSGAEQSCEQTATCDDALATGPLLGVRAGYEFPIHVALELAAGYASFSKSFDRSFSSTTTGGTIRYELSDSLRLDGPFASLGVAYRKDWGSFGFDARVHLGVLLARSRDDVTGNASSGSDSANAWVENAGSATRSAALFVSPGIQLRRNFGSWHVGAGVEVPIFPVAGPDGAHGELVVDRTCNAAAPTPLDCAQNDARTVGERAHGRFVTLVPELSVGRVF